MRQVSALYSRFFKMGVSGCTFQPLVKYESPNYYQSESKDMANIKVKVTIYATVMYALKKIHTAGTTIVYLMKENLLGVQLSCPD